MEFRIAIQDALAHDIISASCHQLLNIQSHGLSASAFSPRYSTFRVIAYHYPQFQLPHYQKLKRLYSKLNQSPSCNCLYLFQEIVLQSDQSTTIVLLLQNSPVCQNIGIPTKFAGDVSFQTGCLQLWDCGFKIDSTAVYKSEVNKAYSLNIFDASPQYSSSLSTLLQTLKPCKLEDQSNIFLLTEKMVQRKPLQQLLTTCKNVVELALQLGRLNDLLAVGQQGSFKIEQGQQVRISRQGVTILEGKTICGYLQSSFETEESAELDFSQGHEYRVISTGRGGCAVLARSKGKQGPCTFYCSSEEETHSIVKYLTCTRKYLHLSCLSSNALQLTHPEKGTVILQLSKCSFRDSIEEALSSQMVSVQLQGVRAEGLKRFKHLKEVDLSGQQNVDFHVLSQWLLTSKVDRLNLRATGVNEAVIVLLHLRNFFSNVLELDLSQNSLTLEQVNLAHGPKLKVLRATGLRAKERVQFLASEQLSKELLKKDNLLTLPLGLRVLQLDCLVELDALNSLAALPLEELRVRLLDDSKFFRNEARIFSESVEKTLRKVDFSDSLIRFKLLRYVLAAKGLKEVILNRCRNVGDQCEAVSRSVEQVQVQNLMLPLRAFRSLLGGDNVQLFKQLDLRNQSLNWKDTLTLVSSFKFKVIQDLAILPQQFHQDLFLAQNKNLSIERYSIHFADLDLLGEYSCAFLLAKKTINAVVPTALQGQAADIMRQTAERLSNARYRFRVNDAKVLAATKVNSFSWQKCLATKELALTGNPLTDSQLHLILRRLKFDLGCQLVGIQLEGCRSLSPVAIQLIPLYHPGVRSLNLLSCSFQLGEVQQVLAGLGELADINRGIVEVDWKEEEIVRMQKYMGYLLRTKTLHEVSFKVGNAGGEAGLAFQLISIVLQANQLVHKAVLDFNRPDFAPSCLSEVLWSAIDHSCLKDLSLSLRRAENLVYGQFIRVLGLAMSVGLRHFSLRLSESSCVRQADCPQEELSRLDQQNQLQSLSLHFQNLWWADLHPVRSLLKGSLRLKELRLCFVHCDIKPNELEPLFKSLPKVRVLALSLPYSVVLKQTINALKHHCAENEELKQLLLDLSGCTLEGDLVELATLLSRKRLRLLKMRLRGCFQKPEPGLLAAVQKLKAQQWVQFHVDM